MKMFIVEERKKKIQISLIVGRIFYGHLLFCYLDGSFKDNLFTLHHKITMKVILAMVITMKMKTHRLIVEKNAHLGWIHNNSGHKIEEDMIAVSAPGLWVTESNLQLVHSFQQNSLSLILQVLKRCFLGDQIRVPDD